MFSCKKGRFYRLAILIPLLLLAASAALAAPFALEQVKGPTPLKSNTQFLPDPERALTIADVSVNGGQEAFEPVREFWPLRMEGAVWLRFSLIKNLSGVAGSGAAGSGAAGSGGASGVDAVRGNGLLLAPGKNSPLTTLWLPKSFELSNAEDPVQLRPAGWEQYQPDKNGNFALAAPSGLPMSVYLRLDSPPDLWFNPVLLPGDSKLAEIFPLDLALQIILGAALLVCLLRWVIERAAWRFWAAALIAAVLAQTFAGLVGVNGAISMKNYLFFMLPGLSFVLLCHLARHMLQTPKRAPLSDNYLIFLFLPGIALAFLPLVPGFLWTFRLAPLLPLLFILLLPPTLGAIGRGVPGAIACFAVIMLPFLGAVASGLDLLLGMNLVGRNGYLYGFALAGLVLALGRALRSAASRQAEGVTDQDMLHAPTDDNHTAFDEFYANISAPAKSEAGFTTFMHGIDEEGEAPLNAADGNAGQLADKAPAVNAAGADNADAEMADAANAPAPDDDLPLGGDLLKDLLGQAVPPHPAESILEQYAKKLEDAPARAVASAEGSASARITPAPREEDAAAGSEKTADSKKDAAQPGQPAGQDAEESATQPAGQTVIQADIQADTISGGPEAPAVPETAPVAAPEVPVTPSAAPAAQPMAEQAAFAGPAPAGSAPVGPAPTSPTPTSQARLVPAQPTGPVFEQTPAQNPGQNLGQTPPDHMESTDWRSISELAMAEQETLFFGHGPEADADAEPAPTPIIITAEALEHLNADFYADPAMAVLAHMHPLPEPKPAPVKAAQPAPAQPQQVQQAMYAPAAQPAYSQVQPAHSPSYQQDYPQGYQAEDYGQAADSPEAVIGAALASAPETGAMPPRQAARAQASGVSSKGIQPPKGARIADDDLPVPAAPDIPGPIEGASVVDYMALARVENAMRTHYEALLRGLEVLRSYRSDNNLDTVEGYNHLEIIDESLSSMGTVLNNLGNIASGRVISPLGDKKVFNLPAMMRQCHAQVQPLAESKGVGISWFISPYMPQLFSGYEEKLKETIALLLFDSIEATDNGAVQLSIRPEKGNPNLLSFTVTDSGNGIPPMQRPTTGILRAWELSSQASQLLPGSAEAPEAEDRGGAFELEFVQGSGMQLKFSIPLEAVSSDDETSWALEEERQAQEEVKRPSPRPLSGSRSNPPYAALTLPHMPPRPHGFERPHIILGDMPASVRRRLNEYLSDQPYTRIEARSVEDIIVQYQKNPTGLVILDGNMPASEISLVLQTLNEIDEKQGVLPVSTLALVNYPAECERMLWLGCNECLVKPFKRDDLRTMVESLLPLDSGEPIVEKGVAASIAVDLAQAIIKGKMPQLKGGRRPVNKNGKDAAGAKNEKKPGARSLRIAPATLVTPPARPLQPGQPGQAGQPVQPGLAQPGSGQMGQAAPGQYGAGQPGQFGQPGQPGQPPFGNLGFKPGAAAQAHVLPTERPAQPPLMDLIAADEKQRETEDLINQYLPLPGIADESLDPSVAPLLPGFIRFIDDSLRDINFGLEQDSPLIVQEAAEMLAGRADVFGLKGLERIARRVERAGAANDMHAVDEMFSELEDISDSYLKALSECHREFLKRSLPH